MPRKIKVVHLITRLDFGGAQKNTLYTVSHLDINRFDVTLLSGPGGTLDPEAKSLCSSPERPFRLCYLSSLARSILPWRDLAAFISIWRFLRAAEPDIVHTHSSKAGILGRLAARLAGVPVILHTYHGFGFHEGQPWIVRAFYARMEKLCCRVSAESIFVSEANRRYAVRYGLISPTSGVLIRSGVALAGYPAALPDKAQKKASLGCRMHKPMVVSIGNLKPQKNPDAFLRVAQRCLQELPETSFALIGDGEDRARLEARILSLGLHGKVHLLGWRRDAAEILAAADAFVLTSLWEGLPRALVEAMRSGLPCVAYATDGVQDVLKDGQNGFVVPLGDEDLLAQRLLGLLKDPGKGEALGRAAAASIGTEFDIDFMVRRQEELYARLAARHPLGKDVAKV
ncbi:MAG: glycosyltransferase family 4 protein [Elusimicrobia bacterium]|nr:glycosyltransferase family 4 protein [Elusimicrobiota bacterium]